MASEWDKFPTASPLDAALQAEGARPEIAKIARSIYEQESGSGKNTKTSNAGAVGGMQIIPSTFKSVADRDWDINNPEHNARAGVRYISQLHEKAGGDPALTAAGYYGGPGGMEKARRGVAVSDPRNPNAPTTIQYAQQVVSRMEKKKPTPAKEDWSQFPEADDQDVAKTTIKPGKDQQKTRSVGEDVARQVGLTVRHGLSGALSPLVMGAEAAAGLANAGLDLVRGDGNGYRFPKQSEALQRGLSAVGLPEPENATERVVGDVASAMAGTGAMFKGAESVSKAASSPVAREVAKNMLGSARMQVASAASGSGAAGATREAGGSSEAQIAAGLIGSLAPGVTQFAKDATWRGVLRGGESGRKKVEASVEAFKKAGTTPTVAQAVDSRAMRGVESALGKIPGGAGVIAKRAQQQADEMSAAVQRLSDELAPDASAVNAGEAITRGVQSFKNGIKTIQGKLYDDLDKHLPAGSRISVAKTQEALKALNADIEGAPNLSEWFKNSRIKGIDKALQADLDAAAKAAADGADSALPYEAIKKLRTLVGNEIADNSLVSDVPRSKWKALYGALSDDLGTAARQAGPKAEESWTWANTFTKKQLERLDQLSTIVGKDAPEKVFKAAVSGTNEGDTIIKRVINALPKQERREVAAAVIQKLGRATPGQQNAVGDAFSSETFLTNISKISPSARQTLFGRTDIKGIEEQVVNFAKLAESRRDGGRVFANPSGTAASSAQMAQAGSIGAGIVTANPAYLAAPLVTSGAANVAARHLTNPEVVRKLATTTQMNAGTAPAAVNAAVRTGQAQEPVQEDWSQFPEAPEEPAGPMEQQQMQAPPAQGGFQPEAMTVDEVQQDFNEVGRDAGIEAVPDDPGQYQSPADPPQGAEDAPDDIAAYITNLRDAGEKDVADLLQSRNERRMAVATVDREVEAFSTGASDPVTADPGFQTEYKSLRVAGLKPAEAAGRASIAAAIVPIAQQAGMSEKAVAAIAGKAKELPIDKIPGFIARSIEGLAQHGMASPLQDDVEGLLDSLWERAATVAMRSVYKGKTNVQNAPQPPGNAGQVAQAAATQAPAPARGDETADMGIPTTGAAGDVQADGVVATVPEDRFGNMPDLPKNPPNLNMSAESVQKTAEREQVMPPQDQSVEDGLTVASMQPQQLEDRQDGPQDTPVAALGQAFDAGASPALAAEQRAGEGPGIAGPALPDGQPEQEQALTASNDILMTPEMDAVHAAATSPLNDLPEPTEAQKVAGNYKVGRVRVGGMDVSIENPQGSERRGVDADGNEWVTPMRDHYGYFKGTTAADGDKLDVFIKPGTPQDFAGTVFVVDQVDPKTGRFDEHKVVFGASDQAEAEEIYRRNYSDGWGGLASVTALPMSAFKAWASSKETRKPLGDLNADVGTSAQDSADATAPEEVEARVNADGTLMISGDRDVIKQAIELAGVPSRSVMLARGGYLIGKTQAKRVWEAIQAQQG